MVLHSQRVCGHLLNMPVEFLRNQSVFLFLGPQLLCVPRTGAILAVFGMEYKHNTYRILQYTVNTVMNLKKENVKQR